MGSFKLSKNSKKNIKGTREGIIVLIDRVLRKSPHDFGIPGYGGFRTAQEQNNLYHSRVDGKRVTYLDGFKRKSYHQSGNAFDIFLYIDGRACWDCVKAYSEVAKIFKEEFKTMKEEQRSGDIKHWFKEDEQLYWGGDWKRFKDRPHFEIR